MSKPVEVIFNTQEQLLSTDLMRVQDLSGKALMDALLALGGGVDAAVAPRDVVRRGLDATPGAGMQVVISAGELMRFAAGPSASVSEYRYGILAAAANAVITAADGVNPRIDRISALETTADSDSTSRNIISLPSRTVTPTPVNKTRSPTIGLVVTAGVAAAMPAAPATPAGRVPLWDVLVPAGAVSIGANHLMDLRVRMRPAASSRRHFRERGLQVGLSPAGVTTVRVTSGYADVDGAAGELFQDLDFPATGASSIIAPLEAALGADQEWHVYAVAKGQGVPVGKNITDGMIFVLSAGAPNAGGFPPGGGVTYNPLYGVAGAPAGLYATTQRALYVGSLRTDGSGNFEFGSGGVPLNRDGSTMAVGINPSQSNFAGWSAGFIKKPRFSWVDASTIRVGSAQLVLNGVPLIWAGANATWADIAGAGDGSASDAASTFYYVYLRFRVVGTGRSARRSVRIRISTNPPNELGNKTGTPETGFQNFEYVYVGSFFNNAAQDIVQFVKEGSTYLYVPRAPDAVSPGGGAILGSTTTLVGSVVAFTSFCPSTSRIAVISYHAINAGTVTAMYIFASTGNSIALANASHVAGFTNGGNTRAQAVLSIPVHPTTKQWEAAVAGGGGGNNVDFTPIQMGYVEDVMSQLF